MFLATYEFKGEPDGLLAAYERLAAMFGDADLQICARTDDGIVVLDACPSRATFEQFSRSREFADALASVGLPTPTARPLGLVHRARLRERVG